jgi:hypothetical protein
MSKNFIDVVFDGPPSHESGRFVEVEGPDGAGIDVGEWVDRGNGYWALRFSTAPSVTDEMVERALAAQKAHSWDASSMLCTCGELFEATMEGNRLFTQHQISTELMAALGEGQ